MPESGAVLVLTDYAGPERGHLAVVRSLVSSREIRVDHANWLGDGAIYLDDPVADVSENNDWSQVRVWNIRTGGWGTRIYPVQGFIGPGDDRPIRPEDHGQFCPDRPRRTRNNSIKTMILIKFFGHGLNPAPEKPIFPPLRPGVTGPPADPMRFIAMKSDRTSFCCS